MQTACLSLHITEADIYFCVITFMAELGCSSLFLFTSFVIDVR